MSSLNSDRLRAEADLMEAFTSTYGRKFSTLIEQMNQTPPATDLQCLRLCVEAVNMMLTSQAQVARTLKEIAGTEHWEVRHAA